MIKPHLFSLPPEELDFAFDKEKSFRKKQLLEAVFKHFVASFAEVSTLKYELRERLGELLDFSLPTVVKCITAPDGTRKLLLELHDGLKVETVIMPETGKLTLCLSSQAGCGRGCAFCATATLGLKRNLTVAEIIAQVFLAQREMLPQKVTNLVFMGMGEPLDNYDNVLNAVKLLQNGALFGISPRRMTISTCGVVEKIRLLAESNVKIKLAVSLNAAEDEKRNRLMPINEKYPLRELKEALLYFRKKTAYRVTLEYILIANFNMGKKDILGLIQFGADLSCKLNLIKWNAVAGLPFLSPSKEEVDNFIKEMEKAPFAVMLRKSRGADIAAACGQLAAKTD